MPEYLSYFLSGEELDARELLHVRFGADIARTYQFWEAAVARIVAGHVTSASCPWDVEIAYFTEQIRIEVKFSQEFTCQFRQGSRQVYKFALPKGGGKAKDAHVIVFVGLDAADAVDIWVAPAASIGQVSSITLTVPRTRTGADRSMLGGLDQPLSQLLPEVVRAYRCHLRYDREHHAETRLHTRGIFPLFEVSAP